jgi:hypothetical protein
MSPPLAARTVAAGKATARATSARVLARDPRVLDGIAGTTAVALRAASPRGKRLAAVAGVSESRVSRWRSEGRGNPAFDFALLIHALADQPHCNAGVLVALARSTLDQALMPISDADLVRRFWTLMEEESIAEGRENMRQAMFALDGNLGGLADTALREAGLTEELAAVCRELQRRRIDPRQEPRT